MQGLQKQDELEVADSKGTTPPAAADKETKKVVLPFLLVSFFSLFLVI